MTASIATTYRLDLAAESQRLLDVVERTRFRTIASIEGARKAEFGQFMTPANVATIMAGMFRTRQPAIRLLDPGAGVGSLTGAFVARELSRSPRPRVVSVTAYEFDGRLVPVLKRTLELCQRTCESQGVALAFEIREADYIADCAEESRLLLSRAADMYDCVIMNPPYRKIHSQSATRGHLRSMGLECSNLYSAFMLLGARQLTAGGEFVSISPRSFCNGPYFRPFRHAFLRLVSLRRLHVFESRTEAFKDDEVLQENVIVYGVRSGRHPAKVAVSSTRADGTETSRAVPPALVVRPDDREEVIHIVSSQHADKTTDAMAAFRATPGDLGISVSTGRVVDYRARQHLRSDPGAGTAPLIFPVHLRGGRVEWPNAQRRKPNAIDDCERTADLLVPRGFYVLVKRFSAKEERRRIVAGLYDPRHIRAVRVGFDNKTNYFHIFGRGLPEKLARGLTVYLNCSAVDEYFRLFSGHTQVNAADLRRLPYPATEQLTRLAVTCRDLGDQGSIDAAVSALAQACR